MTVSILAVDDSNDIILLYKTFLSTITDRFDSAENGLEALKLVESYNYDLVILDMEMPILDGFDTSRELRRSGFLKPILAVTGCNQEHIETKCISAGCSSYIAKPASKEILTMEIYELLNPKESHPLKLSSRGI